MDQRSEDLELIARALSIGERLALLSEHPECCGDAGPEAEERVAAWARQVSPEGDEARFAQRLSWLGLDRAGATRVAATPRLPESFARPDWYELAERVRAHLLHAPAPASVAVAFGEYWHGWGAVGRARLEARLDATGCELPAAALAEAERGLVSELSSLGASCLIAAFDEHRLPWQLGTGPLIARLSTTPPTRLYESFVRELRTTRLAWTRWPALIRLCATRVLCWIDAVSEFARRLNADREALCACVGRELGPLVSLNDRLSDSHDGGRRVFLLTFAHDVKLVYKPRGVRSERAFNEVVGWANRHLSEGPHLESYWVLDRDTHGWTDYVAPRPCPESEARSYYERAGMLLGLAHVLVGSDCHEENVIAHGACPVLVDLETFTGPKPLPAEVAPVEYVAAIEQLETESVLSIGMLPGWTWSRPGAAENSGLAGEGKGRRFRFAHLNTDLMRLVQADEQVSALCVNQPRLASGAAIDVDLHVDAILAGFERVYALACREAGELRRPDGPAAAMRSGRARFVFRDTAQYTSVLGASLKPRAMADGFARSVCVDALASPLLGLALLPDWAPALLAHEHEALLGGDVPLFMVGRTEGVLVARSPELDRECVLGTMQAAGTGAARLDSRLRRLGSDDLRLQRQCIESSFIGRAIRAEAPAVGTPQVGDEGDVRPRLEQAALRMARAVQECSLVGPRGGRFWLGLEPETGDHATSRVGVLGPWLYSGQTGIALALAAAFARYREPSTRSAALAALAPVRELALQNPALEPLGAFEGLTGLIYVLWHSARLLDEPSLVDDARRLLHGLDRDCIERDRLFDVTSGLAGLILAVRCMAPVERQRVHDLVEASARHLVNHAERLDAGVGWTSWIEPRPLCGVAHGNSGIAWALMEAFRMIGDPTFREVSLAATAYERARRAETTDGAWPDLRGQASSPAGWCHGPAGIALARCAMLEIDDAPELRADLEIALGLMHERAALEPRAHLCCGQTGIDDAMLELGLRLHDPGLVDEARRRACSRVHSLGDNPGMWMHPSVGGRGIPSIPGLMKGWAGIILTLLRLSDPGRRAPSVLTLEP